MPKARTKRVPVALHSELTEYSSLLRALRTEATLDLSAHLSRSRTLPTHAATADEAPNSGEDEVEQTAEARSPESSHSNDDVVNGFVNIQGATSPPASNLSESPRIITSEDAQDRVNMASSQSGNKRMKRKRDLSEPPADHDTWTRWPLLPGDVYPPEWSFQEEVAHIARGVRRIAADTWMHQPEEQEEPESEDADELPDDDALEDSPGEQLEKNRENRKDANQTAEGMTDDRGEDSDEDETDPFQHALSASAEHHLRTLLTLCALPIPRVALSMRNRLAPMDWVGVLNAVALQQVVGPDALMRVRARLEAIYGKYSDTLRDNNVHKAAHETDVQATSAVHEAFDFSSFPATSLATIQAARERLNSLYQERVDEGDGDIFVFHGPRVSEPVKPKRKHRKKTKPPLESNERGHGIPTPRT